MQNTQVSLTKGDLTDRVNAQKNLDVGLTDDEAISLVLLLKRLRENGVGLYAHNLSESVDKVAAMDKLTIALHRDGYDIWEDPDVTSNGCG